MKLVDVKEIAQILNVKPSTVYQWAELGQIPCIKLNGSIRFDIEDITNWIKSCKRDPHSSYNPFTQARGPRRGGQ
ncbi:MAG: helix-turn-helix domain-containing protein [Candidatus Aenigmarchaeota archaeon]|nr:helix-turn-helix domain-containing protein [Candidatus Aenigmarchaeota archaeon]